jgi:hypothetical protein
MPKNDYDDPELQFPRLEARIQRMDGDFYWLQIWLWKVPGGPRQRLMNQKWAGNWRDAHEYIKRISDEHEAWVDADDIDVE